MTIVLRATVVGINEYEDRRMRDHWLRFARADAEEVAAVLCRSKTFAPGKVDVLTNERATEAAIHASLVNTFKSRSYDDNTIALFYFAGHGTPHPLDDRIILCGYDIDSGNPNRGGIRLNDIYDMLLRSSATCNIAIIDACFSGGIVDIKRVDHISPAEHAKRAIESLKGENDKTIAIFAACRSTEAARESPGRKHGIYTDELLHGWRDGLARDEDGVVSLLGLADFLSRRFSRDNQVPQFSIRGATQIALWQAEPRAPGETPEKVEPLKPPSPLTRVYGAIELPTLLPEPTNPRQARRRAFLVGGAVLALVALCAFSVLTPVFQIAAFAWGILLAAVAILITRWTIPLALAQLAFLIGYGYNHFNWRIDAINPVLLWLSAREPVLDWAIAIETIIFLIFVLLGLMQ